MTLINLTTFTASERASWEGLRDLAQLMPSGWSLAGGTLVRLHAIERNGTFSRSTTDIDLILNVRAYPHSKHSIGPALRDCGFSTPMPPNPTGKDHRWVRPQENNPDIIAQIDVLAPSFLGKYSEGRKFPHIGKLFQTRGAQVGIDRSEFVDVNVDGDFVVHVNRPDLVGALYEKCSALMNSTDAGKERHCEDIAVLCQLFETKDIRELRHLRRQELQRLQRRLSQASRTLPKGASLEILEILARVELHLGY